VHAPSEEDKKKGKDKKRKTENEVLITNKGKAQPRRPGKPDDLTVYCPIHRSTMHSFMECSVYKKQRQEEEQACRAEAPIQQEPPRHREDQHDNNNHVNLGENEIATIYGGTSTPASKTKLKQVKC